MTPPRDGYIGYKPGDADNNAVLKVGLVAAWGDRCYLCTRSTEFSDLQIDHIIPHTLPSSIIAAYAKKYRRTFHYRTMKVPFDVHAPHNLAPICAACNRAKGNKDFVDTPALLMQLEKANDLRPEVAKRVEAFRSNNTVAKAMVAVSIADLTDPATHNALLELGPVVINRLRAIAPEVLAAPSNYDYEAPDADQSHRVLVTLTEQTRRARIVFEDFYERDFDELLNAAAAEVKEEIEEQLRRQIELDIEERHPYPDVGPVSGRIDISITHLEFIAAQKTFEIAGTFDADVSAHAAVHSNNDSGTSWVQGDVSGTGTFDVSVWPKDNGARLTVGALAVDIV